MAVGRLNSKRLAKRAAGNPAELRISALTGNGSNAIAISGASTRDGLISALAATGGSAYTDFTSTAEIIHGGSLDPGQNVSTWPLLIFWWDFNY